MVFKWFLFAVFLVIHVSDAAVFLWSNRQLDISPLKPFTIVELVRALHQLNTRFPEVFILQSFLPLLCDIKEVTKGFYSVYVPNGDYEDLGLSDKGDFVKDESDLPKLREVLSKCREMGNSSDEFLAMVFFPNRPYQLYKREAVQKIEKTTYTRSVIYKNANKSDLFALLYSSQPPLLKINSTFQLHLKKPDNDLVKYDTRLHVHVMPLEEGSKVTLRFNFTWVNGYWSLPSVKVVDTNTNGDFDLIPNENIMAPAHFSYHCSGTNVFSDVNGVELHIYDLQVQPDSKDGKFGDANDCVPFTTAAIWSGLFVTILLGIGLTIALMAIMDIKTMDKFDNYRTKNLVITTSE